MTRQCIALLSGGLDSAVATAMAQKDSKVQVAITFDYGQRSQLREIEIAQQFCSARGIEHRVIELPWLSAWTKTSLVDRSVPLPGASPEHLEEHASERARGVWVPNRNGVFVAIAAALAESEGIPVIVAGFNSEEAATFPDNSAGFLNSANSALSYSTLNKVRLESPTLNMTKAEIAREFVSLGLNPELFWPCYEGGELLCGRCESCARTISAFRKAGSWEMIKHRF